jgi:hypothetical protein
VATAATIDLVAEVTGQLSGTERLAPARVTLASAVGQRQLVDIAAGDNTITVAGATPAYCIIVPPPGAVASWRLKGAGGDTGVPIAANRWTAVAMASSSFILNSSAVVSGVELNFL